MKKLLPILLVLLLPFTATAQTLPANTSLYGLPFTSYIAFGDSITFPYHTTSQISGYTYYIGQHINLQGEDLGVGGSTANTTEPVILGATLGATNTSLVSYMIGANNSQNDGNDTNQEQDYAQTILAQYAFLGLGGLNRVTPASSFTYSCTPGTGTYTISKKITTNGCTATFTVTGTTIYLSTVMQALSANGGSATMTVDGVSNSATMYFASIGSETLISGNTPSLTRITGLTNTSHTVVVTSTSTNIAELEWAAGLSGASQPNYPVVLAGSIPNCNNCTDATWRPAYRAYQPSSVATLNGDGLTNIIYVNNTSVAPMATFTASSSGTTSITVSSVTGFIQIASGTALGATLYGAGAPTGSGAATFVSQTSGTTGGAGVYVTSVSTTTSGAAVSGMNQDFYDTLHIIDYGQWQLAQPYETAIDTYANRTLPILPYVGGIVTNKSIANANNFCIGPDTVVDGAVALTTGYANVGVGPKTCYAFTTGNTNTGIGVGANQNVTTGSSNSSVGYGSGPSSGTVSFSNSFGYNAATSATSATEIGQGTCALASTLCYAGIMLAGTIDGGTPTFATGSGLETSVVCTTGYTCTNRRGNITVVGGTFTTGTIVQVTFSATYAQVPGTVIVSQNNGATFYGLGHSVATTTGFQINAAVSVSGATISIDYDVRP